ncbi:MAG: hypothetical protein AAB327_04340 [Actinomycetota bacterium]
MNYSSKFFKFVAAVLLFVGFSTTGSALATSPGHGILNSGKGTGVPLFVIIEVNWDGTGNGDWTLWGPVWDPVVGTGTALTGCTNCLEASYDFVFKGTTVQFDESYISYVDATPQVRHVVLHDADQDGTYTGSISAERYEFPSDRALYMDRIDYEVTFAPDGSVIHFRYLEYEHRKLL